MDKYILLNAFTGEYDLEDIRDTLRRRALKNVEFANRVDAEESAKRFTAASTFADAVFERIKRDFFNPIDAKKYAFAYPLDDVDQLFDADETATLLNVVFNNYGDVVFTPARVLAWCKLQDDFSPDFNGKTKSETQTDSTGTSEQSATSINKQKFNSGVTAATTGTANQSDAEETQSGLTTGETRTGTTQEYAHEYAGDAAAFARVNAAASNMVQQAAQVFFGYVIPREMLFDFEIIRG